ncbi:uncharacterized protein LOC127104136 [Lathyrus oleraceus]|uniref:uncharacterized protein LOC127104136 n=1 Tax=Pisum sativum TaxID=3888 RepID=UPI0021D2BE26|nr:uncharacterized protein LOC127104136 [Pisum sativum]
MADFESNNAAVRESLAHVQRTPSSANPTDDNVTRVIGVTNPAAAVAGATVETPVETVVPTNGNRQLVPADAIAPKTSQLATQVALSVVDPTRPANYQLLDDIIRAIEGLSAIGIDARDLCLVSNVVLPQKFKVSDLPKYKGLSCPRSHITMYCRKMVSYIDNDDLLIHYFQESLSGASLDWLQLQNQAQRSNETFTEYAQRWREMTSRVRPALSDNELVDIFMGTLQELYYEKMIGSSSINFTNMVTIGEHVENGLKSGKRSHEGFAKKKEGEENAVTADAHPQYQFPMALMSYYPYPYVAATQYQQPPCQYQPQKINQQSKPSSRNQNQQYNRDNKAQGRGQNNKNNFGNRP